MSVLIHPNMFQDGTEMRKRCGSDIQEGFEAHVVCLYTNMSLVREDDILCLLESEREARRLR